MIVSEHKRTSYDQNGTIAKVDILRSIRKKQAEPSFLKNHTQNQQQNNTLENNIKNKTIQILQYFFIIMIVGCFIMLMMRFMGVSLNVNINTQTGKHIQKQQIISSQNCYETDWGYSLGNMTEQSHIQGTRCGLKQIRTQKWYLILKQAMGKKEEDQGVLKMSLEEIKRQVVKKNGWEEWANILQKIVSETYCILNAEGIVSCQMGG